MKTPRNDDAHADDARWIERATALLDRSVDDLDAPTLSRLTRARHAAIEAATPGARRRWVVGAGLAAASVAALALGMGVHRFDAPTRASSAASALDAADIDFVTADDDAIDLYENLDFYAWLGAQPGDKNG
jgi:hypothetical protein